MAVTIGKKAPQLTFISDQNQKLSFSNYTGQYIVLFFYPKDLTPGCTQESCEFNDALTQFKKLGAAVLGISKDSVESHQKFRDKYGFQFPLLSDPEGKACEAFGVWKEKKNYGKTYMGIVRSTFIIGPDQKIKAVFENVKVKDHVSKVLETLKNIIKESK